MKKSASNVNQSKKNDKISFLVRAERTENDTRNCALFSVPTKNI